MKFGSGVRGMDGIGREQLLRNLGRLPGPVAAEHPGPLNVIWDDAPAYRGEEVQNYLRTSGPQLRPRNLLGYSPDFNTDEAIWGWVRNEVTGNLCLGTKELVQSMPQRRLGRGSATSPLGWPGGKMRSNGGAVPSCNQWSKTSLPTPRDSHPDSRHPRKCTSHLGSSLEC